MLGKGPNKLNKSFIGKCQVLQMAVLLMKSQGAYLINAEVELRYEEENYLTFQNPTLDQPKHGPVSVYIYAIALHDWPNAGISDCAQNIFRKTECLYKTMEWI